MNIKLHKNARTTPAVRAEIAASTERACALAARYGVTEGTIYKWKKQDPVSALGRPAGRDT
jgi:transposase-like protein